MIFLKHKRKVIQGIEDPELEGLLKDAHEAHQKIRSIRSLIKQATEKLRAVVKQLGLGLGTWTFEIEGVGVKVIRTQEIEITDVEGLKRVLGGSFDAFVEQKVVYKPTKLLVKALQDADAELSDAVRDKVEVKIKTDVRWS